jgi:hypothetical protein
MASGMGVQQWQPKTVPSLGTTPVQVKLTGGTSKPGGVSGYTMTNPDASNWCYLKLYDTATVPTVGTTPVKTLVGLPPNGGNNYTINGAEIDFRNGIWAAVTASPADNDTTPPVTAPSGTIFYA